MSRTRPSMFLLGMIAGTHRRKHGFRTFISGIACFHTAGTHVQHHRRNLICAPRGSASPLRRTHVSRTSLPFASGASTTSRRRDCHASVQNPTCWHTFHHGSRTVGKALLPLLRHPRVVHPSHLLRTSFTCPLRRRKRRHGSCCARLHVQMARWTPACR